MAWIEKRKKGYLVGWREPGGRLVRRAAPNFDAARELKAQVELQLFRDEYVPVADREIELGAWIESVIAGDLSLRDSTKYGYRKDARYLAPLARRPLRKLSTAELRTFLGSLDVGEAARGNVYRILAKALNQAVREGLLVRSPLAPIQKPRVTRKVIQPLTSAEVETLIAGTESIVYKGALALAAYGGLRAGEVAGLRWQDVDFLRGRITIQQQVARVGGRRVVTDVKTASGRRTVSVPRSVIEMLSVLDRGGEHLFRTGGGNLMDAVVLNKACQRASRALGRPVNFHLLRHSCAAMMIALGAHPKAVQLHMGHSSIGITMDVYGHLFEGLADETAVKMEALRADASEGGKVVAL